MISSSALFRLVAAAAAILALTAIPTEAANSLAGQYQIVQPNSLASAMMMGLISDDYVFILDKVEGNPARISGTNKPVWGSIFNLNDNTVTAIDVNTNVFCASGLALGNGSWIVAGGNNAISYGGATVNDNFATAPYQDFDGRRAIRMMDPVSANSSVDSLVWIDAPGSLQLQTQRWYPGVESLADGSMVLIGGATNGGYINRNLPNNNPAYSADPGLGTLQTIDSTGGSNPSFEFYPSKGDVQLSQFMVNTSGLNMYAHMFLMPSGNIFMQANYSTTLWNYTANTENHLPDMPDEIIRVYPASGAVAMLPLTPGNNYTPTILFCGGFYAEADQWGDFTAPIFNPLKTRGRTECHSITPENADGSVNESADYTHEEDLPEPRSMGQFIHLPTGQMVIVNGASNGTAGYGNVTADTMTKLGSPYGWSNRFLVNGQNVSLELFTQEPTLTPVLYDPDQPMGSRLTRDGFGSSTIPRLYHSSALLLPDGSVLVGGSNPHMDYTNDMPPSLNGITPVNTEYQIEKWYPPYFFEERPQISQLPTGIAYGGDTWSFTVDSGFMGDSANYKANHTKVMVIRPGFSTHAMNMGQRSLQLEHSYTVNNDGSVTYTVMPMPQNANLFAPGPALLFVTVDGVPSKGKYIQVGSTSFGGTVPSAPQVGNLATLPQSVNNAKFNATPSRDGSSFGTGAIVGVAVGAGVLILLILLGLLCWRRQAKKKAAKRAGRAGAVGAAAGGVYREASFRDTSGGEYKRVNTPSSSVHAFAPTLPHSDSYRMQNVSGPTTPYYDNPRDSMRSPRGLSTPSGDHQGWGEHHGGDAGDYYRQGGYNSAAYYNNSSPRR